ncbi:MAG: phosphoribosylamine--glycine ligase, partial [Victivallaceae bacterium]
MKILVVGNGGREHTLCWKLAQSPQADKIYCAPGNAGIATVAECVDIAVSELEKLAGFAESEGIDFTVVGPEAPLCAGIVNVFRKHGLKIFGPDKEAAQLEGSKDYAKQFMFKYNIPTAKAAAFDNAADAAEYVKNEFAAGVAGIVIKADGLAAGKGVCVALEEAKAMDFVKSCFDGAFGGAGSKVLVEECLFGEEASILAFTDGKTIVPLVSSQDHKRAYDG